MRDSASCESRGRRGALLIALWVRSFRVRDDLRHANGTTLLNNESYRGEFGVGDGRFRNQSLSDGRMSILSDNSRSACGPRWNTRYHFRFRFQVADHATWLLWLPRRFSLRTLLIVTTLVAVVLEFSVYALRTH